MELELNFADTLSKEERYERFIPLFASLIKGERNEIGVLANTTAALHQAFHFFWTGFYLVADDQWLKLGPFQGRVACWSIRKGRGVCGTAWEERRTQVVPDVDKFPGHIACSSLSRSEIVVPLKDASGRVHSVLDIDSDRLGTFDETDRIWLERVCRIISHELYADE